MKNESHSFKKKAIFLGALEVFAKNGYEGATLDDIAERGGVAKGTIYNHFKSKDDLFLFLIRQGLEELKEELQKVLRLTFDPGERLGLMVKVMCLFFLDNPNFANILISEVWGSEARRRVLQERLAEILKFIEDQVRAGIEARHFRPLDPELMATSLFGAASMVALRAIAKGEQPAPAVINDMADLLLKGILEVECVEKVEKP